VKSRKSPTVTFSPSASAAIPSTGDAVGLSEGADVGEVVGVVVGDDVGDTVGESVGADVASHATFPSPTYPGSHVQFTVPGGGTFVQNEFATHSPDPSTVTPKI